MDGKGSASQTLEITGRSYQAYNNTAPMNGVKLLRKHGDSIAVDKGNPKEKKRIGATFS